MKYTQQPILERGILTSNYKRQIKHQAQKEKSKSLSAMKSIIINHQNRFESSAGTILRVSVFMMAIIFMIS